MNGRKEEKTVSQFASIAKSDVASNRYRIKRRET